MNGIFTQIHTLQTPYTYIFNLNILVQIAHPIIVLNAWPASGILHTTTDHLTRVDVFNVKGDNAIEQLIETIQFN